MWATEPAPEPAPFFEKNVVPHSAVRHIYIYIHTYTPLSLSLQAWSTRKLLIYLSTNWRAPTVFADAHVPAGRHFRVSASCRPYTRGMYFFPSTMKAKRAREREREKKKHTHTQNTEQDGEIHRQASTRLWEVNGDYRSYPDSMFILAWGLRNGFQRWPHSSHALQHKHSSSLNCCGPSFSMMEHSHSHQWKMLVVDHW